MTGDRVPPALDATITVRAAVDSDHAALVPLARDLQDRHAAALPLHFSRGVHALPWRRFRALVRDPAWLVIVAEVDGRVAGFATAGTSGPTASPAPAGPPTGIRADVRAASAATRRAGRRLQALAGRWGDHGPQVERPRREVFVEAIVVDPRHRGTGIGQALLEATRAWAVDQRAELLSLTVCEFNARAIALYERFGMTTINRSMSLQLDPEGATGMRSP